MFFCTCLFFNGTATSEIYTLSLHDALPISQHRQKRARRQLPAAPERARRLVAAAQAPRASRGQARSEEHTSELQSRFDLVCRLLLEKKKSMTLLHPLLLTFVIRIDFMGIS